MLAYAGRGRVHITRHQLNDSIREGLPLVESLMPENVNLVLDLQNDLPRVNADPNQVRYAMLNLVVNAMETLGNQQGEIAITTAMNTGKFDFVFFDSLSTLLIYTDLKSAERFTQFMVSKIRASGHWQNKSQ